MTNTTMTRDEAANLYREARAQAVSRYGYTAERFDSTAAMMGGNAGGTPAAWLDAAQLILFCEWENNQPWPGDEVRGMSFPKVEERPAPCEPPASDRYKWTEWDAENEIALARAEMGLVALDRPPLERA